MCSSDLMAMSCSVTRGESAQPIVRQSVRICVCARMGWMKGGKESKNKVRGRRETGDISGILQDFCKFLQDLLQISARGLGGTE